MQVTVYVTQKNVCYMSAFIASFYSLRNVFYFTYYYLLSMYAHSYFTTGLLASFMILFFVDLLKTEIYRKKYVIREVHDWYALWSIAIR